MSSRRGGQLYGAGCSSSKIVKTMVLLIRNNHDHHYNNGSHATRVSVWELGVGFRVMGAGLRAWAKGVRFRGPNGPQFCMIPPRFHQ